MRAVNSVQLSSSARKQLCFLALGVPAKTLLLIPTMPAFRNIRRSRRISRQPPRDPASDEYDVFDLTLMYPDDTNSSSPLPAAMPDAPPPPSDEVGEHGNHVSPPLAPLTGQRSSHSRKRKPGHIPRPPNAFMIFRSDLWSKEKIKSTVERDHRQISRIAGSLWNELTEAERVPYRMRADEAKREHARLYPEYKYSPIYRRDKPMKQKSKPDHSDKVFRAHQIARLFKRGFQGDELEREMRDQDAQEEDYSSAASEYVEAPRRKKARTSSSKTHSAPPRRRSRHLKVEYTSDDEEPPVLVRHDDAHLHDDLPKEPSSPPEDVPAASVAPEEGDDFVPTADIPDFSLGEPAYSVELQFTNPFAAGDCLPPMCIPPFANHDPLSPALGSCSLSDDFLGSAGEEHHPQPQLSPPEDALIGIFDERAEPAVPVYDRLESDYMSALDPSSSYYAQYVPGHVFAESIFSDWVREDSYE